MLYKYLEPRWREHIDLFGIRARQGNYSGPQYPKSPAGCLPAGRLATSGRRTTQAVIWSSCSRHHLDANRIELGILAMIRPHPGGFQNLDLSGALCRAINDWQVAEWTAPEPRLKASIVVPYEDAAAVRGRDRPLGWPSRHGAGAAAVAHRGAARQPALLADLRGGRTRGRIADRNSRVRQWRTAHQQHRVERAFTSRT